MTEHVNEEELRRVLLRAIETVAPIGGATSIPGNVARAVGRDRRLWW